ncbi:MAG: adenylosuccinate synthetase [Candidatus Paceibacterota bacterium]|jgi:adenylosuccinate synthase
MKLKNFSQVVPVLGLQWGDEGKGKGVARIANTLGKNDLIVRFQGGNNAGHTIYNAGKAYVFHLIPSAVFGQAQMHMGAGMVINPAALLQEASEIPKNFSFLPRLSISPHAVLTMPTHLILDSISEQKKGKKKIGSTGKGISPAYTDLTARKALRVGDIAYADFKKRYEALCTEHKKILRDQYGYDTNNAEFRKKEKDFFAGINFIKKLKKVESVKIVEEVLNKKGNVVAEGAQGTLLDVRFGHYPYVTSSHTIAGGVATGLGLNPSLVGESIGVMKAYVTKVGEGPFPTELGGEKSAVWCRDKKVADEKARFPNPNPNSKDDFEQGVALRRKGSEIGATTGRLRRTGWLDLPLVKYAIDINNSTKVILTKLDVLDGFKKIKVCTHYTRDGKKINDIPFDLAKDKVTPVYKSFPVWKGSLTSYGRKLPLEAINYIKYLEKKLNVDIIYVGNGPEEHHVVEKYW